MQLYRRRLFQPYDLQARMRRLAEIGVRISALLLWPLPATIIACTIWYEVFYSNGWHIENRSVEVAVAAWLPIFGVLYTLLAAVAINTVFGQYMEIRAAVKSWKVDRFMELRNEDLSPIFHAAMTVLACAVIFGFMWMDYPSALSGFIFVGSTTYLFSLMFQVISEVDNPCDGIWFIKSIPEKWMLIDARVWHQKRVERAEAEARIEAFLKEIETANAA